MYCKAPFLGYAINPEGINCCSHYGGEKTVDLNKLRLDIYNNKIPKMCKVCSLKTLFDIKLYDDIFQENLKNFNKKNGDIKNFIIGRLLYVPTFKCNAKCINCNTYDNNCNDIDLESLKYLNIKKLKYLLLQGGEITLNEKYFNILDLVPIDCEITIMTNGMIYNKKLYDKLIKFKNNTIVFSIDGFKENNDILRPGTNYEIIKNNILKLRNEYPSINIEISYIVNKINAFIFLDEIRKIYNDININGLHFCISPVYLPYYLSINSLSKEKKKKFKFYIKDANKIFIRRILQLTNDWRNDD